MSLSIVQAIKDPMLFRNFLADRDGDIDSWNGWLAVLRCMYGLPVPDSRHDFIHMVTGRPYESMPATGFSALLALTGRRCGKSRVAAICAAHAAALSGRESKLAKGENGMVAVVSPTRDQSRVVKDYLEAVFTSSPLLRTQVVKITKSSILLRSGVRIEIAAGSFSTIRGYTLLAAVVDEAAFFGMDDDAKVKSDGELIAAIKPALITTGGPLIVISSPYAERGWCYRTHQQNFGNASGKVLVVNAPSKIMNPTLPQEKIDEALQEDYAKARSEYYGEFRQDVGLFIPRAVVETCVIDGRTELAYDTRHRHVCYCDISGGRSDGSALAIAHREGRKIVVDKLLHFKAPHNPHLVIADMAKVIKQYGVKRVQGDRYAAEFTKSAFEVNGLRYDNTEKVKSQLYLELLPLLTSATVELPDDELLIKQLCRLERKTRSGGVRDIIDHPSGPNNHDDLANAVAGACVVASQKKRIAGGLGAGTTPSHSY